MAARFKREYFGRRLLGRGLNLTTAELEQEYWDIVLHRRNRGSLAPVVVESCHNFRSDRIRSGFPTYVFSAAGVRGTFARLLLAAL